MEIENKVAKYSCSSTKHIGKIKHSIKANCTDYYSKGVGG